MQKDTNLLNDRVVSQRNSLLVQLPKASLVDQFPHTLQVGIPKIQRITKWVREKQRSIYKIKIAEQRCIPKGHIRFNPVKHIHGCLVYFEEDTIEDLTEKDSGSSNIISSIISS